MSEWYVYELVDPRDGSVFYVGKGKGNRIDAHEKMARKDRQSPKSLRIMDIEGEGYKVIKRKIALFDNENEAYAEEAARIDEIGLESLTNMVRGGGSARDNSASHDRKLVRNAAIIFKAVKAKNAYHIRLGGQYFPIYDLLKSYQDRLDDVIERRTLRWVNFIAKQERMEF